MLETVIVWTIVGTCAFFLGRKFWRQWRAATSEKGMISCGCGCSCSDGSICPPKSKGCQR